MRVEWGNARLGVMGILGTVRIMGNVGASWDTPWVCPRAVVMGGEVRSRRESTASTTNAQIGLRRLISLIFQWLACR